jgi:serine/threonine protein kinase/WD40 repeat protein
MNELVSSIASSRAADAELERIVEAAIARLERGEPVDFDALVAAHPEYAGKVRELLPAIEMLVHLGAARVEAMEESIAEGLALACSHRQLGDFRLIRELGRGGMGTVFEAEQLSMGRRVALKVLPFAALVDGKALQRFRNEVRAAAALDHPHIVSVYSVGEERGVHFYAMQLIRGRTLGEVIEGLRNSDCGLRNDGRGGAQQLLGGPSNFEAESRAFSQSAIRNPQSAIDTHPVAALSTSANRCSSERYKAAARLAIQAAEALQHAHDQGVLHRDVKPGNLMVDADEQLYVTDFGLARIVTDVSMTMTGDMLGTLRYMAPEQAAAGGVVIDHRADIYSLGATLYELLALRPAFGETDRGQLLKQIASDEPPPLRKVDRRIPTDLGTIVLKAMAKARDERYQTARQMADDLRAYLEHRPIKARPASWEDRLRRWSRRHHQAVQTGVAALLLVSVVLAGGIGLVQRSRREALASLEQTSELLYATDMARAYEAGERGWAEDAWEILQRQLPDAGKADRRGFEWRLLAGMAQPPGSRELSGHQGSVNELTVLPQRGWLASAGHDGTLRFWDAASGTLVRTIQICHESLDSIAVSRDERYVAVGSRTVYVCDLSSGFASRELARFEHIVESLAFSPGGDFIAAGAHYHEIRLVKLNGEVLRSIPSGARMESLEFQPNASLLLAPNGAAPTEKRDTFIELWNLDLPKPVKVFTRSNGMPGNITLGRFSPNGKLIAAGRRRAANVLLFEAGTGRIVAETPAYRAWVTDVSFSPAGNQLAVAYRNGTIQIFDVFEREGEYGFGANPRTFSAHTGEACCARFISDNRLATCGIDGLIRIWTTPVDEKDSVEIAQNAWSSPRLFAWKSPPSRARMHGLRLSPDGSRLLYLNENSKSIYNTANGELMERIAVPSRLWGAAAWSPSGATIALGRLDKPVLEVVDQHKNDIFAVCCDAEADDVAFSQVDDLLAVIGHDSLQVVRADDGTTVFKQALSQPGQSVSFSPDGKQLAYGGQFQGVVLLNPTMREVIRELPDGTDTCCLAFSPDGSMLAAGQGDGVIRAWEVATGQKSLELKGHEGRIREIAFSPDGRTIVSSSNDGRIRLWSVGLGCAYGVLHQSDYFSCHFTFSADGRYFAAGWQDQSGRAEVLLWRLND